jgi:acyl carrier protein
VRDFAVKIGAKSAVITEKSSLADDLGLDSLDIFELSQAVKKQFNIQITPADLNNAATIADVANLVASRVGNL